MAATEHLPDLSGVKSGNAQWIPDEVASLTSSGGKRMWIPAAALFGAGDILTTMMGFSAGAVESNQVPAHILGHAAVSATPGVFLTLLTVKALMFAVFVGVWALFPVRWFGLGDRWRVVVPGVLTVMGVAVVAYNLHIIVILAA